MAKSELYLQDYSSNGLCWPRVSNALKNYNIVVAKPRRRLFHTKSTNGAASAKELSFTISFQHLKYIEYILGCCLLLKKSFVLKTGVLGFEVEKSWFEFQTMMVTISNKRWTFSKKHTWHII